MSDIKPLPKKRLGSTVLHIVKKKMCERKNLECWDLVKKSCLSWGKEVTF